MYFGFQTISSLKQTARQNIFTIIVMRLSFPDFPCFKRDQSLLADELLAVVWRSSVACETRFSQFMYTDWFMDDDRFSEVVASYKYPLLHFHSILMYLTAFCKVPIIWIWTNQYIYVFILFFVYYFNGFKGVINSWQPTDRSKCH